MEELENKIYEFGKTIKEAPAWGWGIPTKFDIKDRHVVFNFLDDDELPYYTFCEFLREMGQILGFKVEKIEFINENCMHIYTTLSEKIYCDLLEKYNEKYNEESEDEETDI